MQRLQVRRLISAFTMSGALVLGLMTAATAASNNPVDVGLQTTALSNVELHQLATISKDQFGSFDPQCVSYKNCTFGATSAKKTVVLFGDSHIQMWLPALIPSLRTYKVLVLWRPSCPIADLNPWNPFLKAVDPNCPIWRHQQIGLIKMIHPVAVIVAERTARILQSANHPVTNAQWQKGIAATLAPLVHAHIRTIMIGDAPSFPFDPIACLGRFVRNAQHCTLDRRSLSRQYEVLSTGEKAGAAEVGASFIDPTPWLCTTTQCPAVLNNSIAYFDWSHLTVTETLALKSKLVAKILPLL